MPINISDISAATKDFLLHNLRESYPNLDTSPNSPIVDLFANPLQSNIRPIIEHLNSLEFMMNLDNAVYMTDEELDKIGQGNYFQERKQGDRAVGEVVFCFKSVSESDNLTIPNGVALSSDDGLQFFTTFKKEVTPSELYGLYNPSTYLYEVPVMVEAADVGSKYNIGENLVTKIDNSFSANLVSVSNRLPMSGGSDKESNAAYAARLKQFYISRQLGTAPGYAGFITEKFAEIKDVLVVGFGDELMERDKVTVLDSENKPYEKHIGGKVDIYLRGTGIGTDTISYVSKSNNLSLSKSQIDQESVVVKNVSQNINLTLFTMIEKDDGKLAILVPETTGVSTQWYSGDVIEVSYDYVNNGETASGVDVFTIEDVVLKLKSPFVDVIAVSNSTQNLQYNLSGEEDIFEVTYLDLQYKGTSHEESYINLVLPSIENGDHIEISYSYNNTIHELNNLFNEEQHRVITTDILVKEAASAHIHIGLNVKLKAGQRADAVKESAISNMLIGFLNSTNLGGRIEESDIVGQMYANDAIASFLDYVELPFLTFHKAESPTESYADGVRDGTFIQLGDLEYPSLYASRIYFV